MRADPEGRLSRIDFVRNGEYTPIVPVSAPPDASPTAPLRVQFSSAGTRDIDGDRLAYAWASTPTARSTGVTANPRFASTQRGVCEAGQNIAAVFVAAYTEQAGGGDEPQQGITEVVLGRTAPAPEPVPLDRPDTGAPRVRGGPGPIGLEDRWMNSAS